MDNGQKEQLEANAQEVAREIDTLAELSRASDYGNFWRMVKEINSLFRANRFFREDREELQERFQQIIEKTKEKQNTEREKSSHNSEYKILPLIKEAANDVTYHADGPEALNKARALLSRAMDLMKTEFLLKTDRDTCWTAWRDASQGINDKRESLMDANFQDFKDKISEIRTLLKELPTFRESVTSGVASIFTHEYDPHQALQCIKETQAELRQAFLNQDQRERIRERLQLALDEAIECIEAEKETRRQKHEAWRGRTESRISQLEGFIENNDRYVETLQGQIGELEEQIANAWSEDWADRRRGWIQEKHNKIAEVEQKNEELRNQIQEMRNRLDS